MQMPTSLELLKLRLESKLMSVMEGPYSIQSLREEICEFMTEFPQYYSWSNRCGENGFQVEIFDRTRASEALLKIELELR